MIWRDSCLFGFNDKKESFKKYGKKITLFNGVETYFNLVNDYAKKHKINLEHYIISSGLREIIESTKITKHNS